MYNIRMTNTESPKVKEYRCHHPDCNKVYKTVVGRWKHTKSFHPEYMRKNSKFKSEETPEVEVNTEPSIEVKNECCENCTRLKEVISLLMKV
jgi:hypothetical protein